MQGKFDRLLAKSQREGEPFSQSMRLIGHLKDVYESAVRILDSTGADQLKALGLSPDIYLYRFRRCVLLAAALHDLGKANDHFQGMIHRTRNVRVNPQGVRHEWITIVMLRTFKPWLLPAVGGSEVDFSIVEWAIAGHHPAPHHDSPPKGPPQMAGVEVMALLGHPDVTEILGWVAERFPEIGSVSGPTLADRSYSLGGGGSVFEDIGRSWRSARQTWNNAVKGTVDSKFAAVIKVCLIAADIAGSALAKAMPDGEDRWSWIARAFANRPQVGDLEAIYKTRLEGKSPRIFQERVASSKMPVTFVKAGCGTGKTVAAYMWAARNHPNRRLYFCYPTTGTATEGFKDYLFEPNEELGDLGAKLFHSRRDIDFEIILTNGRDAPVEQDEIPAKLEALEAWSTPIAACTVDTVLGLLQNNRRGVFAWPALAQSVFVFDEIHSYDESLFGALLRFLTDLPGLPVLLMTASLPAPREEALREVMLGRKIAWSPIEGPKELEQMPRFHKVSAPKGPTGLMANAIHEGAKVLRVCNTVNRVIAAADEAATAGLSPLIYHSRFRYVDRVKCHKAVVDAFTLAHRGSVLAICSQVAEMSLDLKGCTLLVTDNAPVPSEIQRLGRLNRQANPGDSTQPFCVVEPDMPAPYEAAELKGAREWMARLPDQSISQHDLTEKWEHIEEEPCKPVESAWLDGGPITLVRELRELSPGISVLMRDDVERMKASRGSDNDVGRYVIPMPQPPRDMHWREWDNYKGIPIAERSFIDYDRKRGGQWAAKQQSLAPDHLTMDLFAPGMTAIHRAGLGGLACTLQAMEPQFAGKERPWEVTDRSVTLKFGKPEAACDYLKRLFAFAFKVRDDGLISLAGQFDIEPSAAVLADLQAGLTLTFLQHGKVRLLAKEPTTASYDPTETGKPGVSVEYRKCSGFKHQQGWEAFVDKNGRLIAGPMRVDGPLSPGTVVRHVAFNTDTAAEDPPERMLPLYFAIIGCLALAVNRGVAALLVPEVTSLTEFKLDRPAMTPTKANECQIANAADAVLQSQIRLRGRERMTGSEISGCYAMTFMPTPWASQQKSRVATLHVSQGNDLILDRFQRVWQMLPNRIVTRTLTETSGRGKAKVVTEKQHTFRAESVVRPLIAENLATGRPWYAGFANLMFKTNPATDKPYRNQLQFERKGLHDMMNDKIMWDDEGQELVVRAVHEAIRQTLGRIRDETDGAGGPLSQATKNRWERFREKLRLDLVGAKTQAHLRFALTDLFSRGGSNAVLRESWTKVLPVIQRDWNLARDLGLLALASYVGRGETSEPTSHEAP